MGKYKALKNLTVGDGSQKDDKGKHVHREVKKGEVFECDEAFAEEHLVDHGHAEESDEPVTAEVKLEAKKKAKLSKKEQQAADKAAKAAAKEKDKE